MYFIMNELYNNIPILNFRDKYLSKKSHAFYTSSTIQFCCDLYVKHLKIKILTYNLLNFLMSW